MNEHDEAQFVAAQILSDLSAGKAWKDHAVLYRMNAQSNQIEQAFKKNGIPYRIIGGIRFFDRAEVKDMVAYLCAINNPNDDLRLSRIINNPPRGIGATTIERAQDLALQTGRSLWEVVKSAREFPELQKAAPKLGQFTEMMEDLRRLAGEMDLPAFYEELVERTGYAAMLEQKKTIEDRTRLENVHELSSSIQNYLDNAVEEPSLSGFLDEIALYTDLDNHDSGEDCVVMMTMHSAKGLEFPVVFVVGVEEGIFPGIRAIGEPDEMEEERRLCYVAMTRAKERLYMTCASQRMLFGRTNANRPSRFLGEIPEAYVEKSGRNFRSENESGESGWQPPQRRVRPKPVFDRGYSVGGYSSGYSAGAGSSGQTGQTTAPAGRGVSMSRPTAAALPNFQKGDSVVHKAFGKGLITGLTPMGGDALVEIAFEKSGTKKLMLKAAAQHMTKE